MTRIVSIRRQVLERMALLGFSIDLSLLAWEGGIKFMRYNPSELSIFVFAIYFASHGMGKWCYKFEVKQAA